MSYESVQEALKTQLDTVAQLAVYLEDSTKIQGGAQKIAKLSYAGMEQERRSMGGDHVITWTIEIELYFRYTNDAATRNGLRDLRNAILNRVNAYHKLGGASGVFDAFITRGETRDEDIRFGSIQYYGESLFCEIQEEVFVTYQE